MDNIVERIKQNWIVISVVIVLVLGFFWFQKDQSHDQRSVSSNLVGKTKHGSQPKREKTSTSKMLTVDIQGAVKRPGVYKLPNNSIIQDAIGQAGGPNENAEIKQVNRAQKITDSMQIYIPIIGETTGVSNATGSTGNKKKVNLNNATVDDFKDVSGIGPKKAEKIISYREKNGNYSKIEDLSKVGGFGTKTIEKLRDELIV